jgi:hypothetical protein
MSQTKTAQPSKAIQKFEEWTPGMAAEDAEASAKATNSIWLKLTVGSNVVRYLPAFPGKRPFRVVYMHQIQVPGTDYRSRFPCPRKESEGKDGCAACNFAQKLQAGANRLDQERGQKLLPDRRVFANVHPRNGDGTLVRVHEFGKKIHDQIIFFADKKKIDVTHPIRGMDVDIVRVGTGQFDTRYNVMLDVEGRSTLADDALELDGILDARFDLDRFAAFPTSQEIAAMMRGEKVDWRFGSGAGTASSRHDAPSAARRGPTASDMVDGDEVPGEGEFAD